MEGVKIEELEINEEAYQAWKKDLDEKRDAKKQSESTNHDKPHIPRNPQYLFDEAAKRCAEARATVHVEASSTDEIFRHIDELLEAS